MATERARGNHDDGRACKLCGGHGYGGETCPHCGRQPTAEQVMDARRCEDPHALLAQCKAAEREAATLRELLDRLATAAEEARGHHGIEECSGPGQPATEWDETQDELRDAAARARAALAGAGGGTDG